MIAEPAPGPIDNGRIDIRDVLVGVALILANLVLRTLTLRGAGLSLDEAASVWHCGQPWEAFIEFLQRDATPPLYSMMLRVWTDVFGIGEVVVRLPSVTATSITAGVIYIFGRRWMGRQTGFFAAVIFSLSPLQMVLSQTARVYAIAGCFCALSMYFFVGYFEKGDWKRAMGLVLADLAIVYSHYAAGLLLVARCVVLPGFAREGSRRLRTFAALQGLVFVGSIPALLRIDSNQIREPGRWFEHPGIGSLWGMWVSICGGRAVGILIAFLLLGCCVGLAAGHNKMPFKTKLVFATWMSWGVGSVVVGWAVSQWVPLFVPRYLAFAGAGLALAVAGAVAYLLRSSRYRKLGLIAAAGVLALSLAGAKLSAPIVEDWRGAVHWIEAHRRVDTKIIVSAGYQCRTLIYELNREIFREYQSPHKVWFEREGLVCVDVSDANLLDRLDADHLILVQSHAGDVDPKNLTKEVLEVKYSQRDFSSLPGIKLASYGRFVRP